MKRDVLVLSLLVGCLVTAGCKNNNLFGDLHKEGSGDAQSLVADGQAALSKSEFSKADNYFSQALEKDPSNSDALYGQCAAKMGLSGLSLGQLIANLTQGNGTLGSPSLRGAINQASAAASVGGASLLSGIDAAKLDEALKVVIQNLEKIRMGHSDGKIARDDGSLLINLGLARLLKAAAAPLRAGVIDIQESGGSYTVQIISQDPSADCDVIGNAIHNVAWGFLNLSDAAIKLKLVSGSTLSDITNDVDNLYVTYYGGVHTYCSSPDDVPTTRAGAGVPISESDRLNP
jgi:tetratricopeptide (TPR) repeat protein